MNVNERRDQIIRILTSEEYVTVEALSRTLDVSKMTIRTDLDSLEKKGLLMRTHGGATLTEKKAMSRMISKTINEFRPQKSMIARTASSFIEEGSTIIIDSGSTTVHLTRFLGDKHLTVVTGSIPVIADLSSNEELEIVVLGGMLRRASMASIGYFARGQLEKIHADILFLGASGYTEDGLYCSNVIEAETKLAMMDCSGKIVLLADSSKEGRTAFANVSGWDKVDVFITDSISPEMKVKLEDKGVEVVIAE